MREGEGGGGPISDAESETFDPDPAFRYFSLKDPAHNSVTDPDLETAKIMWIRFQSNDPNSFL